MSTLLIVVAVVWLSLVTLGLIGVNARITLVRRDLKLATGSLRGVGAASTSPELPVGTVLLLVSETCTSCTTAIDALHAVVESGRLDDRQVYVLSPDPDDGRVRAPLAALADDDLYRRLYAGSTPALIIIGADGEPRHQAPVSGDDLADQLRRAGALDALTANAKDLP